MALQSDYTQAAFDAYLDLPSVTTRLGVLAGIRSEEGWLQAPEPRKEQWLREATLWVRDYAYYQGSQVSSIVGGIAVWPRSDVVYPNGVEVDSASVPAFVLDACMHRALDFSEGLGLPLSESYPDDGETIEQQIGSLRIRKSAASRRKSLRSQANAQERNSFAARLLQPYIVSLKTGESMRG